MRKNYKRKLTKKLLSELKLLRSSLEYCTRLSNTEHLTRQRKDALRKRLLSESHTIQAVENAISLLTPIERKIIELHYIEEHSFEDMEEVCAMDRSCIYRHHVRAVDKIALVLYGE